MIIPLIFGYTLVICWFTKKLIRGPKIIAFELKKSSANIRKILSNLCKEGKITKVGFGEYVLSVNVLNKSVNVEAPGKQGDSIKAYYKKCFTKEG